jgi:hypothetical protein
MLPGGLPDERVTLILDPQSEAWASFRSDLQRGDSTPRIPGRLGYFQIRPTKGQTRETHRELGVSIRQNLKLHPSRWLKIGHFDESGPPGGGQCL